ncbi:TIGR03086 family metal-binding protein [Nocardia australiensis]|uniref:TIGR03086 family metal-binding protein n=1 Tax=Nocardia australiensis TaxID=2887191 RepID=UPI001D136022|nr:TIGR03086 family metal-binding protein [Nocardia australiensis]
MIDLKPACHTMIELLIGTSEDGLADPTPCAEYNVAGLIDHISEVARGFAAIAGGETGEPQVAGAESVAVSFGDELATAAERVRTLGQVWDDAAAWQGSAEFASLELPNEVWGNIALTEMVVHGWDLAVATARPVVTPDPTLLACLEHVAWFVPNAPLPELWGTAYDVAADAELIDRIVAITGRDPRWNAAVAR